MSTTTPTPLRRERLEELKGLYEENGLGPIDYLKGPVHFCQNGECKILKVSEMRYLEALHNAFPSLLHAVGRVERLENEVTMLRILLKNAKCPECDGSGVVVTLDRRHEPYPAPCQWCHYREEAMESALPPAPDMEGGAA